MTTQEKYKKIIVQHDCYEHLDYHIEEFTVYQPTQAEIDQGTDKDETGHMAVCNFCGKDMEAIEIW